MLKAVIILGFCKIKKTRGYWLSQKFIFPINNFTCHPGNGKLALRTCSLYLTANL